MTESCLPFKSGRLMNMATERDGSTCVTVDYRGSLSVAYRVALST